MTEGQPELPEPNIFLLKLKKEGKYADAILTAWGIVEALMDDSILKEFGLSTFDSRSDPILNLRFEDKLALQIKGNLLTNGEVKKVRDFKDRRNKLFHTEGLWFVNLPEQKKIGLTEIGIETVRVIGVLHDRVFNPDNQGWRWDERNHNAQHQKRNREENQHQ